MNTATPPLYLALADAPDEAATALAWAARAKFPFLKSLSAAGVWKKTNGTGRKAPSLQRVNETLTLVCEMGVTNDPWEPVASGARALTVRCAGPTKLIGGVVTEVALVMV